MFTLIFVTLIFPLLPMSPQGTPSLARAETETLETLYAVSAPSISRLYAELRPSVDNVYMLTC